MPVEVYSVDEFLDYARRASECRVKRVVERVGGEKRVVVKVKARAPGRLATLKIEEDKLEELLAKLREIGCEIVEI